MADYTIDQIADKIAKLERLAEGATTPEEAAAAAAKAAELMEAYSVSRIQVDTAANVPPGGYGKQTVASDENWKWILAATVALDYQCRVVRLPGEGQWSTQRRQGTRLDIFGHRDNVRVCVDVYRHLASQIEFMMAASWRDEGRFAGTTRYRWEHSYADGAVAAIASRLGEARRQREAQRTDAASSALIVIATETDNAVSRVYPRLKESSGVGTRDYSGRDAGIRDGRQMTINPTQKLGAGSKRLS